MMQAMNASKAASLASSSRVLSLMKPSIGRSGLVDVHAEHAGIGNGGCI